MTKKGKGWHKEPTRHKLAQHGVRTTGVVPKKGFGARGKFVEYLDNFGWVSEKGWKCVLDDEEPEKVVGLGLVFEIIDWNDYDTSAIVEEDGVEYPVSLFADILVVPDDLDETFRRDVAGASGIDVEDVNVVDVHGYGGGVPATDVMEGFKLVGEKFPNVDSVVKDYGSIGNSGVVRHFKSVEDGMLWAEKVYSPRAGGMMGMVGFVLDRPINRAGNTGWDDIKQMATGKEW